MIKVSHLYYDYPDLRAVNDVSFELPRQSITALVGPNGAGKTTLLRSMVGLDEPTAGHIWMDGIDVWDHPREAHLRMGYLPDHFGLYQELTALQCLTHAAWTRGLRGDEAQQAVHWAIGEVDLEPQLLKLAGTLSRGQRQRLALAQAIVHKPKVLLMDEPASGLDPEARASLAALMKSLCAQGMTLLISSHILAELEMYCTAMLVLEQGRLLAYQSIGDGGSVHAAKPITDARVSQAAGVHALALTESAAPRGATQGVQKVLRITLSTSQQPRLPELCQWLSAKGYQAQTHEGQYVVLNASFASEEEQVQLLHDLMISGWAVIGYAPQAISLQDVYMQTVAKQRSTQGVTKGATSRVSQGKGEQG